MSFPSDVDLPINAKYLGFVDLKQSFNIQYDIVWSFEYSMLNNSEGGFVTSLVTAEPVSAAPGHYLGSFYDSSSSSLSSNIVFLLTEDGEFLIDDDGNYIVDDASSINNPFKFISVAFDSTGLFALSTATRKGVGLTSIKPNSLIIRDENDDILLNTELSALDSNFSLYTDQASAIEQTKVIRIKYTNGNKVTVDYKNLYDSYGNPIPNARFTTLTSVTLPNTLINTPYYTTYPAFSYSSPVSSPPALNATPNVLLFRNFHVQGYGQSTNIETLSFQRLTSI